VPVGVHQGRVDPQHDRLAMSLPDATGRVSIGREVHVLYAVIELMKMMGSCAFPICCSPSVPPLRRAVA
jgi:hypothetical protein